MSRGRSCTIPRESLKLRIETKVLLRLISLEQVQLSQL